MTIILLVLRIRGRGMKRLPRWGRLILHGQNTITYCARWALLLIVTWGPRYRVFNVGDDFKPDALRIKIDLSLLRA